MALLPARPPAAVLALALLAGGCSAPGAEVALSVPDAPEAVPDLPDVGAALAGLAGELAAALAPARSTGVLLLPLQDDVSSPERAAALEDELLAALVASHPPLVPVLRRDERDALLAEADRRGPAARARLLARLPALTGCLWALQPMLVRDAQRAELVVRAESLAGAPRVLGARRLVQPASLDALPGADRAAPTPAPSAPVLTELLADVGVALADARARPLALDDPLAPTVPAGAETRLLLRAARALHVAVLVTSGAGRLSLLSPGEQRLDAGERRLLPSAEEPGLRLGERPRTAFVVLSSRPLRDDPALSALLDLAADAAHDPAAHAELLSHLQSLVGHGEHWRALVAALDLPPDAPDAGPPPLLRSPALRRDAWGTSGVERTVAVPGRGATVVAVRLLPAR